MANDNKDGDNKASKADVKVRPNATVHLDKDANDPRRNVAAEANLSNLTEEDPETDPQFQNPVT